MANCDIYTTVSAELPCVRINLHAYLCMDVCLCVHDQIHVHLMQEYVHILMHNLYYCSEVV